MENGDSTYFGVIFETPPKRVAEGNYEIEKAIRSQIDSLFR